MWTSLIQKTLRDFQLNVSPREAFAKARAMIRDATFLNISGVAVVIACEGGVDKEQDVRACFLSKLDDVMDAEGPGEQLLRVLNKLQNMNVGLGIVSFMRRPRLIRRLQKWNLISYFGSLATPEDFAEFKPSPLPFLSAIDQLELVPSRCFVIGDEPADMEGGRKAGARTLGVPHGFFTAEELLHAGAETTIDSLGDLPKIVADP